MRPVRSTWGLLCGAALLAAPLRAAEPAADADLLEYLGSVDSEEAAWHEYLATTDVDKLVQHAAAAPAGAPPAKTAYPASAPPEAPAPRKGNPT
jgi:hypothetical protein